MGRQPSGPRKVMVRLEYSPKRILPVPARFVNVQLAERFEPLPPGHLSRAIRPAVVRQRIGVLNPHVLSHRLEPRPHELTARSLQMTAGTSKIVSQCLIMALETVLVCRPTPCLSFLSSFLEFLPGTATIYPLCLSTARMTQS